LAGILATGVRFPYGLQVKEVSLTKRRERKMKRKRRYVFAVLTFFGTLAMTAGNCFKVKKNRGTDEESASAPMFPGMETDTDAGRGAEHLRRIYAGAAGNLRSRGVMSKAFRPFRQAT